MQQTTRLRARLALITPGASVDALRAALEEAIRQFDSSAELVAIDVSSELKLPDGRSRRERVLEHNGDDGNRFEFE